MIRKSLILFSVLLLIACGGEKSIDSASVPEQEAAFEAISLGGDSLVRNIVSEEAWKGLNDRLDSARSNWEAEPNEENYIWYGRRLAYMMRYTDAIKIFTEGLEKFPDSYKLYRHRGHRYVSIRQLDAAIADLQKAAELIGDGPLEIEPDGLPNKLNIPLSNTHFNIYYHLGLAHYLKGDWESALGAYKLCMEYSVNDDLVTATADWMYMTLMRMGDTEGAAAVLDGITEDMEIIENDSYHRRLLMYKGLVSPDSLLPANINEADPVQLATQGYGLGNHLITIGDTTRGVEVLERVLEGSSWSAFGYIAAEADLVRIN